MSGKHVNGQSNGTSGHTGSFGTDAEGLDETVQADQPLPPPPIAELAASCAQYVLGRYGVGLDFTSHTLSLLDQYVRDARREVASRGELLPLMTASIGAYLGEVMRRAFGATWYVEGNHENWRLDFRHVFLTFNPLGMALEALTLETAEGWHAHLEADEGLREELAARLEALPEVAEDEYFSPTTRFDVVEIAIEVLRAGMMASGNADVTFEPTDYRRR